MTKRPLLHRLLDALTHTGPGYQTQPADAPWVQAYGEEITAANERASLAEISARANKAAAVEAITRAEYAEAINERVRVAVAQWRDWNPTENAWAIRDIERALSGEPDPQPQAPGAIDCEQPATKPGPRCICGERCICGDPIERWTGPGDPGWIHTPGSDTACLDARPAEPLLRSIPPEIHVHVTPQQVADAVRRIIREDCMSIRDVIR